MNEITGGLEDRQASEVASSDGVARVANTFDIDNLDARYWAHEFLATFSGHEVDSETVDEGLMIGWFANAIESGRRAADSQANRIREEEREKVFAEVDAAIAKLVADSGSSVSLSEYAQGTGIVCCTDERLAGQISVAGFSYVDCILRSASIDATEAVRAEIDGEGFSLVEAAKLAATTPQPEGQGVKQACPDCGAALEFQGDDGYCRNPECDPLDEGEEGATASAPASEALPSGDVARVAEWQPIETVATEVGANETVLFVNALGVLWTAPARTWPGNFDATHWMPLPEPPTPEDGGQDGND